MISVCITVKNRSRLEVGGREILLLPNCLQSVAAAGQPDDVEIVVSDWHSDDWPLSEWAEEAVAPLPLRIVTVDGDFSRGRGRNVSAGQAKGDVLLFLDAEIIIPQDLLEYGLRHVAAGRAVFPVYHKYAAPEHTHGDWCHGSFGNAMLSRDLFLRSGRWPELERWGGEDNMFHEAVRRIAPIVRDRLPGMRHQWHPNSLAWKDRYATP